MNHPAIRFSAVTKKYATTPVLRGIDFAVTAGSAVGLSGVNGAGKTTLIKCLLDFGQVDSGAIEIYGVDARQPAARAKLAYLPEKFLAPYFLTGREFVRAIMGMSRCRYDEDKTCAMFDALDLDRSALTKPVRAYSKGMNQKLGLAACFLSERDLYVLDEPMSGLDPKARVRLKALLKKLKAEGRTIFMTSHSLPDINEMCDEIAVLHHNALQYAGPLDAFRAKYQQDTLEDAFLACIRD
jgi:ABC-type multidrug transport system ATPase subunit